MMKSYRVSTILEIWKVLLQSPKNYQLDRIRPVLYGKNPPNSVLSLPIVQRLVIDLVILTLSIVIYVYWFSLDGEIGIFDSCFSKADDFDL